MTTNKTPEALNDNVLVERAQLADVTPGGIVLPKARKEPPPCYGVVAGVGPDVKSVTVGEVVLFDHQESRTLEYGKQILLVVAESSLYARFPSVEEAQQAGLKL